MLKYEIQEIKIQLDPKYFPLPLDVRWQGGKMWLLLAPFEYHSEKYGVIRADKDFETDFGSKPPITWPIVGAPTDEGGAAYVIHDWLCKYATWSRLITDRIFLEGLRDSDVAFLKRYTMYIFVRIWSYF